MRIIGFNLKKIHAERKKDIKGPIKINTNLDINSIEKDSIDIAGDILKFSYNYEIKYTPEIGELIFQGEVLVIPDKPDIKEIQKDWKKKKIKEEVRLPIFNFIMAKCNLKALQLEEDFGLPPHIPLPRLSKQQQGQEQPGPANYAG